MNEGVWLAIMACLLVPQGLALYQALRSKQRPTNPGEDHDEKP